MIANEIELETTLERIRWFQSQVAHLRRTVPAPANYRAAAAGFLAEIDRMQRDVREFFVSHPAETTTAAVA